MSEPRTFTINTADRGLLTVTEPAWCMGEHETSGRIHAAEIHHIGHPVPITVSRGGEPVQILELALWQDPYPNANRHYPHGAEVYVSVHIGAVYDDNIDYSLDGLAELSTSLIEAAGAVRLAARDLIATARGDG